MAGTLHYEFEELELDDHEFALAGGIAEISWDTDFNGLNWCLDAIYCVRRRVGEPNERINLDPKSALYALISAALDKRRDARIREAIEHGHDGVRSYGMSEHSTLNHAQQGIAR